MFAIIVTTIVAGVAGLVLHECSHAAVAWGHRWDWHIDWRQLDTIVEPGQTVQGWEVAAFALAPFVVGVVSLPVLYLHPSLPALVGWVVLALGGIRNDTRMAVRATMAAGQAPDSGSTPEAAVSGTD